MIKYQHWLIACWILFISFSFDFFFFLFPQSSIPHGLLFTYVVYVAKIKSNQQRAQRAFCGWRCGYILFFLKLNSYSYANPNMGQRATRMFDGVLRNNWNCCRSRMAIWCNLKESRISAYQLNVILRRSTQFIKWNLICGCFEWMVIFARAKGQTAKNGICIN